MNLPFLLGVLAFVLPTMPLGLLWHLTVFRQRYASLEVYRGDMIIPFGIASMVIQGVVWATLYAKLFAGESILAGAVKLAALAAPLAWSFAVLPIAAKHRMNSVRSFVALESGFTILQYLIVSPLIALAFSVGQSS